MITIPVRLRSKRVWLSFLVVCLLAWVLHSYYVHSKNPPENSIAVTVTQTKQKDMLIEAHAIGNVQPSVTVAIKPRVDGQLLAVNFKEGDTVSENQVIFQIDPAPFRVALDQAKANLARDQAQLSNYQKIRDRYIPLVKKGFVSKQDFDQADANVKAQEAAVLSDQSAVAAQQLNLDYCTIRSPITGKTGNVSINQGNVARVSDLAPLVVINKITPLSITFSLPEKQLALLQQELNQGKVPVMLRSKHNNAQLQGELSFVDNTVDTSTGMIKLKAEFANEHQELWPGEYVDVTLPLTTVKSALVVPTRAIQAGPDGSYVFVVNKDLHVSIQLVKTRNVVKDETIIEGLAKDSVIVTTGQAQLVDGSLVRTTTRSIA